MTELSNNIIIHEKKEGVEYFVSKRLQDLGVTNAYTLKKGGFNIGSDSGAMLTSYQKLSRALEISINNIIRPIQTHSDRIKEINYPITTTQLLSKELNEVDGLLTNRKNVFLSLGYADCTPILLYDPIQKVIGNIHSGWRGTIQRIGEKAIKKMRQNYDCQPENIVCFLGPCIQKCHFEVGEEVANMFQKEFQDMIGMEQFIKQQQNSNKYYIDTTKINEKMLEKLGLKKENIITSDICTVCQQEIVHSYRACGKEAGRNTAIIGMKGE